MKIVGVADTHGKHRKVHLPDGDVLIHAGDFTSFGDGQEDFLAWFENRPFDHRLLVLGNHEQTGSRLSKSPLEGELVQRDPITYLGLSDATIQGVRFGSKRSNEDLDVLVTHQPPKGTLDSGKKKVWPEVDGTSKTPGSKTEPLGSPAVRQAVQRSDPDVHIFGHVHRAYGRTRKDGVRYVNCALAGPDYDPVNDPVVIEL